MKFPKFSLTPKDDKFFILFEESAHNMVKIAQNLKELVNNYVDVESKMNGITDLEHSGDNITHQIIALLNRSFITPFDREDITALAHSLDDVTDFIHSAADSMFVYKIDKPTQRAQELADILVQATTEVEKAMPDLRQSGRKLQQILRHCIEINRLENMADRVFRAAQAELLDESTDIKQMIKWREILDHLETATDRCEDVANVLEGVALKHS
jgi:uncharacterized protein